MTIGSSAKKSDFWWYIAAAVIALIILTLISYEPTLPTSASSQSPSPVATVSPSSSPSSSISPSPSGAPISLMLYAGSVTSGSGTYGFGNSASVITSPGPTLNLKEGITCTITVDNVANVPHSFEIVSSKVVSSTPLFGAGIDLTNYISPGSSGSVTFTPNTTGSFYYVCTVPAHISLGMWGNAVVTP